MKAREFSVIYCDGVGWRLFFANTFDRPNVANERLDLIEKSAFDRLLAEAEKLADRLDEIARIERARTERDTSGWHAIIALADWRKFKKGIENEKITQQK